MSVNIGIKGVSPVGADPSADLNVRVPGSRASSGGSAPAGDPENKKQIPLKELEEIASDVQRQLKNLNTELRLEVDGSSRNVIVKVIDKDTSTVIRQIPSEELVKIRERMQELIGVLYNSRT